MELVGSLESKLSQLTTCSITRLCTAKNMNQLFYNIAGEIVHQIRREQRTRISELIATLHPRTVKRIVTALMSSLLFRCFSLFLSYLRTLAQEKTRSQNYLRFGTGGPSLCLYPLLSRNIIFFPALIMAARAKKKFGRSDLLTLSVCAIGILRTFTYTEFHCVAPLAML